MCLVLHLVTNNIVLTPAHSVAAQVFQHSVSHFTLLQYKVWECEYDRANWHVLSLSFHCGTECVLQVVNDFSTLIWVWEFQSVALCLQMSSIYCCSEQHTPWKISSFPKIKALSHLGHGKQRRRFMRPPAAQILTSQQSTFMSLWFKTKRWVIAFWPLTFQLGPCAAA